MGSQVEETVGGIAAGAVADDATMVDMTLPPVGSGDAGCTLALPPGTSIEVEANRDGG